MAKAYSKTFIIGNLGDDPEMRFTRSGKAVAEMSVAVNDRRGEEEHTDWYLVVAWGKLAEACNSYLHKGSSVLVEGRMRKETWEDDEGQARSKWKLVAQRVEFLDPAPDTQQDVPY
jgi:single-strand DNA-binding protein